jgi:hypothetical protein
MQTAQTFAGNGSSTVFDCSFSALAAPDVHVYLAAASDSPRELTLNRDFAVLELAPVKVQTTATYPDGVALRIERRTPIDSGADLQRMGMALQELLDDRRAIHAPPGEVMPALPSRLQRARKVLAFDANGDLIALVSLERGSAGWLQLMLADTVYDNTGAGMVAYRETIDYDEGSVGAALHDLARRIDGLGG